MKKYLCGITFEEELGHTDMVSIFDSIEELKKYEKCWQECGIVEIEIEFESNPEKYTSYKWIVEQDLSKYDP